MVGDDAFKKLQLVLGQVAGRGEVAERLQHGWKGVAACGIVVDDAEGLETREHAVLHDPGREVAAAQSAVGGCEVLLRTKAISTEHERSVHVEQDNSKAGEHAVRGHTHQCRNSARSLASATRSCLVSASTTLYPSQSTGAGHIAPR